MNPAIQKVLEELDGLGESAIRKRILGLDDEGGGAGMETPEEEAAEPGGPGHAEPDGDELSPEMLEKLKALLAK